MVEKKHKKGRIMKTMDRKCLSSVEMMEERKQSLFWTHRSFTVVLFTSLAFAHPSGLMKQMGYLVPMWQSYI